MIQMEGWIIKTILIGAPKGCAQKKKKLQHARKAPEAKYQSCYINTNQAEKQNHRNATKNCKD
jgi:hypothetical protein